MTDHIYKSPRPKPRETLISFLSRLSASKRASAKDFAYDMGGSFKRILNLDEEALSLLCQWGNLSNSDLNELLSWTGEGVGNIRMRFRGEIFVSRALRNPVIRGCPVCLREDVQTYGISPLEAMAMRGDWLLREVVICVKHEHPLVPLWRADKVTDRDDIGARLMEILDEILKGGFDRPKEKASPYDIWLDGRLEDGRDSTWLVDHSLYAASTFCRLLGAAMLDLTIADISNNARNLRTAQAEGFEIARQGTPQIRAALDALVERATGVQDGQRKVFGQLFVKLSQDYLEEDTFAIFRKCLRDCILANWPISRGEIVLGELVPERLLHSLHTAAKETGVGFKVINQFLTEAGAFEDDDRRAPSKKTFDAGRYATLLEEIPTLVGPIEMQTSMGATRAEFTTLERDGVLAPRTQVSTVKSPWRLSDGCALIEELQSFAIGEVMDDLHWESIQQSSKRTGKTVGMIISEIRSKNIQVRLKNNIPGYHGIWIHKSDAGSSRRLMLEMSGEYTTSLRDTISAYAFARSIGLRDRGLFRAFLEEGHSPSIRVHNPRSQCSQLRLTEDNIATFHRNFVTLNTLQAELGLHRNTIFRRLKAIGVPQFAFNGKKFGAIWSRHTISPLFKDV
ncbi:MULTISPECIES: TniQ family protein [Pacificibacter]|uniref:TniQ family protein n=1 Tax=Pacificibacter TaxID=1042323 RepID=UPI001C0811D3|nr:MULTISPECIES: TniQ family protein [Pacificibacter]MBU2936509.1 TniQ family protein [Pacificibacter marinus]MDO6614689.1 TniQ family protein [Pacificibacter sp. 1_MG-2023]